MSIRIQVLELAFPVLGNIWGGQMVRLLVGWRDWSSKKGLYCVKWHDLRAKCPYLRFLPSLCDRWPFVRLGHPPTHTVEVIT
jgi:hypothetical protein